MPKLNYKFVVYLGFFFLVCAVYSLGLETQTSAYLKGHWVVFASCYFFFTLLSFRRKMKYLISPINIYIVFFLFYYGAGTISAMIFFVNILSASTIWLILAGYIFGLFGFELISYERFRESQPIKPDSFTKFRMFNLISITLFLSVVFSLYWYKKIGVIPIFAKDVDYARTTLAQGTFLIRQFMSLAVPAFFLVWVGYTGKRKNLWIWICFAVISFIMLSQGYRTFMLSVWLIVFLVEYRLRGNYINMKKILAFSVAVLLVIFLVGIYRYNSSEKGVEIKKSSLVIAAQIFILRPVALEMIKDHFPTQTDFQEGSFYLRGFNFIHPGSQVGPGMWLKNELGMSFEGGGVNPGILGEFYLNFGLYGILVGMVLYGLLVSLFYKYYMESTRPWVLIVSTVPMFHILLSVSPGIANAVLVISWTCVLAIIYYVYLKLKVYPMHCESAKALPAG